MKRILSFIAFGTLLLISVFGNGGCANIVPPQGGPRDSLPPLLVKSTPEDSTRNFKGNRITFTFDEFVEIQNIQANFLVSPIPKINPVVDYRLNTVTIRIKDSLEDNTTYSFNFGDAIKDYNEGNVLTDFTYSFSTGPYLDSLELRGKVILAENGQVDSTLIVMLHTNADDSAVIKDKPRYVAKLDSKGNFSFTHLPPKTFYLYTLKDESGTRRYTTDRQLFGFADSAISVTANNDPVVLYAYAVPDTLKAVTPPSTTPRTRSVDGKIVVDKRLRYQASLSGNSQDILSRLTINFDRPLRKFDSTGIRLYRDSTFTINTSHRFALDTSRKKITLLNTWNPGVEYHIILDKDFAEDTSGNTQVRTDTISFSAKTLADYGTVKLKFRNLDLSRNPVLQFFQSGTLFISVPMTGPEFTRQLFVPGEYELRILFDENKNGVWDPGEFFKIRKQPEIVLPIERRINIKPNWVNEFELVI